MPEVIGDLSDLILDLGYLKSKEILRLDERGKRMWYQVVKKSISRGLSLILFNEAIYTRRSEISKLNNFLYGRLKRGYVEDGRGYIELFDHEGKPDLYFIMEVEEDRRVYNFTV